MPLFYIYGGETVVEKLICLLAMTLKFMFKEKAKDKAELVMAVASLVREIKDLIIALRKQY